jgi:hypothetical protein
MRRACALPLPLLLLVAVLSWLACPRPAFAQYMFLDTNHDGVCDDRDVLTSAVTSVDVYLDSDRNADGSRPTCAQQEEPFNILSYEFTLRAWGDGTVSYGAWIQGPAFASFTVAGGENRVGADFHTGFGSMDALPPGRYRLGTLEITVTGTPRLSLVPVSARNKEDLTAFGSACPGSDFDDTLKLGGDFTDACGTAPPAADASGTWTAIKKLYR